MLLEIARHCRALGPDARAETLLEPTRRRDDCSSTLSGAAFSSSLVRFIKGARIIILFSPLRRKRLSSSHR